MRSFRGVLIPADFLEMPILHLLLFRRHNYKERRCWFLLKIDAPTKVFERWWCFRRAKQLLSPDKQLQRTVGIQAKVRVEFK